MNMPLDLAPVADAVPLDVLARIYGEPLLELPKDLYIPPDALQVILEAFEGPLDLLLYLIRKANLDVLDIPTVAAIAEYYREDGTVHEFHAQTRDESSVQDHGDVPPDVEFRNAFVRVLRHPVGGRRQYRRGEERRASVFFQPGFLQFVPLFDQWKFLRHFRKQLVQLVFWLGHRFHDHFFSAQHQFHLRSFREPVLGNKRFWNRHHQRSTRFS